MKPKGMLDLVTIQSFRSCAHLTSRVGMAMQLVRLEHERARRGKELQIFEEKRAHALEALQRANAYIDQLKQELFDSEESQLEVARRFSEKRDPNNSVLDKNSKKVRTVTLGY